MIDKPSMRDGLHWKLLGNGLCAPAVLGPQLFRPVPLVRRVVPAGKVSAANSVLLFGNMTPFESTVIPAPS